MGWTVGNILFSVLIRNEMFLWGAVYWPLVTGCRAFHAPTWLKHG